MINDREFKGKVIIITGGAGGIGSEIAFSFAKEGGIPVIADINKENGQRIVNRIIKSGGESIFINTDLEKEKDIDFLVNETIKNYSKVDILVNNVAISEIKTFLDISLKDWNDMLNISLTSHFLCSKKVVPYMINQRKGRIINISSTSGITGGTSGAHYAAAKGGVIALTKAMSRELAPFGITVNVIAPSKIETENLKKLNKKTREDTLKKIPVGRFGEPIDIAKIVLFLASEGASYITSSVILASGGYL